MICLCLFAPYKEVKGVRHCEHIIIIQIEFKHMVLFRRKRSDKYWTIC